jgi:hypothetical protein
MGLYLMLFNVLNAATMGLRPMDGMAEGEMVLCSQHAAGTHHHHQGPAQPASPDCCSCCLSMCCTGAALPGAAPVAPARSLGGISLTFGSAPSFRLHPAPSIGGGARAPPAIA